MAIDNRGREYARLSQLTPGDMVQVDGGFTCMTPWSLKTVWLRADCELYVKCEDGEHVLDGQLMDDMDSLVGLHLVDLQG